MTIETRRFQIVASEVISYYLAHFLTSIAIFLSLLLILISMMFLALTFHPTSSGYVLLSIITVLGTSALRLILGTLRLFKRMWRRYRPPFTSEDFRYDSPLSETTYDYSLRNSAISLHIILLAFAFFLWIPIQVVISVNVDLIIDFLSWLYRLVPSGSKQSLIAFIELISGLPTQQSSLAEIDKATLVKNFLYLPQVLFSVLLVWNVLYYFERETLRNSKQSGDRLSGPLLGNSDLTGVGRFLWEIVRKSLNRTDELVEGRLGNGLIIFSIIALSSITLYGWLGL